MPSTTTAIWTMTTRITMTVNHTNTKSVAGTRYLNGSNLGAGLLTPLFSVPLWFSRLTCWLGARLSKDLLACWRFCWLGSRLGKAMISSQSSISSLAIFWILSNNEGWNYFNLKQQKAMCNFPICSHEKIYQFKSSKIKIFLLPAQLFNNFLWFDFDLPSFTFCTSIISRRTRNSRWFLPCTIKTNRDLIFLRAFSIFITMFAIHCKLNVVITSFFQTFFAQWALKTQYFGANNLFWIVTCQLTMLKASSTTTCPIKEGMKLDNSL